MFVTIRWGTKLYGACNGIKGLGNVQTKFHHVNGIPLCPIQSYFIIQLPRDRGGPLAQTIPLDTVSVGKTYLVAVLSFIAFAFVVVGLLCLAVSNDDDDNDDHKTKFQSVTCFVMAALFIGVTCWVDCKLQRFASYGRAKEIARDLAIPHITDFIDRVYHEQEQQEEGHRQYYGNLDHITEAENHAQNNNNRSGASSSAVMVEVAPILEPSNTVVFETKPLGNATAVAESTSEHE